MRAFIKSVAVATALAVTPAMALPVTNGAVTQNAASAKQQGRLSRDGVPSAYYYTKAFPGVVNTSTTYTYSTIAVTFSANAFQDVFYEVTIDDPGVTAFASAYNGFYDPFNKSLNYLGDAGSSGNYFGVDPGDMQIVVPTGGSLLLLFNQVTLDRFPNINFTVDAFSDSNYSEDFLGAIPEPATWALMILGFGVTGASMRRKVAIKALA